GVKNETTTDFSCVLVLANRNSGCSKPDKITTFKMPDDEISFTFETEIGHGAISSDYTNVYAHFVRNGKADKKEVLSGENLEITKIIWLGQNEATICLVGGITV